MEAFLISTGIVALAEIGDKTQLLSLVLAARFRRPLPIIAGILVATLANHALAGALGSWVAQALGGNLTRWVVGIAFFGMAIWTLIPDRLDDDGVAQLRFGIFATTVVAFFLAEMGDKTQIATVALAARYSNLVAVVAGTTAGMMLANVPVVLLGETIAARVALRVVHMIAGFVFAALGVMALLNVGNLM